jgi:demethylspheroidene O-methyltransferase
MIRKLMLRAAQSPRFHAFAARTPLLRRIVRSEGRAMFDLVQGFVASQMLGAMVQLDVFSALMGGPRSVQDMAGACDLPPASMQILLQSGAGLGLLRRLKDGRFDITARGAALTAVPGLAGMIAHHGALYADLADPVALLRGGVQTQLSQVWPYVFGAGAADDPARAARYSALMADSQAMVAAEVMASISFHGMNRLLDVGGGTGAFLAAVGTTYPKLQLDLFDLPAVLAGAQARLGPMFGPMGARVCLHPGSFRDDPLPRGADAISLIRVLYDHSDETVAGLLRAVYDALPAGGHLIVAEPMSGGAQPDPITDVYFLVYTFAMQTGRTRSAAEIATLLRNAGFCDIKIIKGYRAFIASTLYARKPAAD